VHDRRYCYQRQAIRWSSLCTPIYKSSSVHYVSKNNFVFAHNFTYVNHFYTKQIAKKVYSLNVLRVTAVWNIVSDLLWQ